MIPLFLISLSSAMACFAQISVEGGTEAVAVVSGIPGYGVKAQAAGAVSAALVVDLAGPLGVGLGLALQGALPSDASGDWRLRSFAGGRVGAFLQLRGLLSGPDDAGSLLAGCRLGCAVVVSWYPYTQLLSLWPAVTAEPGIWLAPSWLDAVDFRLSVPGVFYFRSDVGYSFCAGLALTVAFRSGGAWAP